MTTKQWNERNRKWERGQKERARTAYQSCFQNISKCGFWNRSIRLETPRRPPSFGNSTKYGCLAAGRSHGLCNRVDSMSSYRYLIKATHDFYHTLLINQPSSPLREGEKNEMTSSVKAIEFQLCFSTFLCVQEPRVLFGRVRSQSSDNPGNSLRLIRHTRTLT